MYIASDISVKVVALGYISVAERILAVTHG